MKRLLLLMLTIPSLLIGTTVTFINPGGEGDPFFQKMTDFMLIAAEDLDIELEVIYCNRNHITLGKELLTVLEQDIKPDYLLLINEKNAVAPHLAKIDSSGIPFYLFNEGIIGEAVHRYGAPGEHLKNWIGELLPDDYLSGKLLAQELLNQLPDTTAEISSIGLAGVSATNSSISREQGFRDCFDSISNITIHQIVPAYHERQKARFVTEGLKKRYGTLDIIWAASDIMALGAYETYDSEPTPLIGGVDWSDEAIESVKSGNLAVTVGGHFLDGVRVLLSIAKRETGSIDIIKENRSYFAAITIDNYEQYAVFFGDISSWHDVDFSQFVTPTIIPEMIKVEQFLTAHKNR